MMINNFTVESDRVRFTEEHIETEYEYEDTEVKKTENGYVVRPVTRKYTLRTQRKVPKTGLMIVGWGGNNGTTVTAGIIANREGISWKTKEGIHKPDYFGSVTQSSTLRLGSLNGTGHQDVYVPFNKILPMVDPNDFEISGWDINGSNLADAMERAEVLDYDLQRQLVPYMRELKPMPSVYFPDFIAANQSDRANNVLEGTKQELLQRLREDIRTFRKERGLDKVIVLWSANTERFSDIITGVNDTADNLLAAIERGEEEISPSTLFAVASILEGCPFINGSPQNALVPGAIELAERSRVLVGGDDFKSGQTKMKSVLVDFLVGAGIKPTSIVSYNHLGNNDGKNLSAPQQFRSKEISKSSVVDDMVASNQILYQPGEHPDHCVVIKYVPYVGDSKRAMDEYTSEIFLGGRNTIVMHNTCEDSLLASPLIIDLAIVTELLDRIEYRTETMESFEKMESVLAFLGYLCKAPLVPQGTPVVNALFKQRAALENFFRACIGMPAENHMLLEQKLPRAGPRRGGKAVVA